MDPNEIPQQIPPAPPAQVPQAPRPSGLKSFFTKRNLIFLALGFGVLILVILTGLFVSRRFGIGGGGEIVWWGLWEEDGVITPLIEEYQKDNPSVKIVYKKQSPQDYRERLINSLARGEGPDIFRFHNTWVPMFTQELSVAPSEITTPAAFAQTFYPVAVSDLLTSNGIVGFPVGYDALTLFINEEIFEREGKTPPKTWDEVRTVARELTKVDETDKISQAGIAMGRTENVDHWQEILGLLMLQNGVNLNKPEGILAEDALEFFTIFSESDRVWDATLPSSTIFFSTGNLAMYFGPSWRAFEIQQANPSLRFRAVATPQLSKEDGSEPDVSYATYWVEGVWERSNKKDEAWKFLEFLSRKDTQEKFFANASKLRGFGEPYSRIDMKELLTAHPMIGPIVSEAPDAESWYLASRTFDGPTGINSQIGKYFEDAVNAVNAGRTPTDALEPVVQGVAQVLSQYGLIVR